MIADPSGRKDKSSKKSLKHLQEEVSLQQKWRPEEGRVLLSFFYIIIYKRPQNRMSNSRLKYHKNLEGYLITLIFFMLMMSCRLLKGCFLLFHNSLICDYAIKLFSWNASFV